MKMLVDLMLLGVFLSVLASDLQVRAVQYDHSYTIECLSSPLRPQYNGGMILNPEFNEGLRSWKTLGNAQISLQESIDGNKYVVASKRERSHNSISQIVELDKEKYYVLSAWIQVSEGQSHVAAMVKNHMHDEAIGWVMAEAGCWSMLKGGFSVKGSGLFDLYFPNNNTHDDIWVDSVSLQEFTKEEWESHQAQNIEKIRKTKVSFQVVSKSGPLANATVTIEFARPAFPFGNAISSHILTSHAYREWFVTRFRYTVFENEMKWYATEHFPGQENYSVADSMLKLMSDFGIKVRGHNVFWEAYERQPSWVKRLPVSDLPEATDRRIRSVMNRYKGKVIHWDVLNENLHHAFYETRLGRNVAAVFFRKAHEIDPSVPLFLNEFNTLEQPEDWTCTPAVYLQKIKNMRKHGYHGPVYIGLESHFNTPSLPYVRTSIDVLAASKHPIWITELDVSKRPNQELYLQQLLKEMKSHPGVQGIMMWASWKPNGTCYAMCLTDDNFRNLKTGDVVDDVIKEWTHQGLVGTTDINGYFNVSLFHGDYGVSIGHPKRGKEGVWKTFKVVPDENQNTLQLKVFF